MPDTKRPLVRNISTEERASLVVRISSVAWACEADETALMNVVRHYVECGGVLPRRQNFEAFPHYFSEVSWKVFVEATTVSNTLILEEMCTRLADLGLNIASENTLRTMSSFLMFATRSGPELETMGVGEKASILKVVKSKWKSTPRKALERIAVLPTSPTELLEKPPRSTRQRLVTSGTQCRAA